MSYREEILITIRPKYVAKILRGEKTVELRRRQLKVMPGTRVWIYSKGPHGAISAHAEIAAVVTGEPRRLWRQFHSQVGVTRQEFLAYFASVNEGCALVLSNIVELKKQISLNAMRGKVSSFQPPQFYTKLRGRNRMLRVLKASISESTRQCQT